MDHLLKAREEFKNLKKQEIQVTFTKMNLIKACFQHDMGYEDFKDLAKVTGSDNVLRDKAFNIAKYDGYQRELASMIYKMFDKKSRGSGFNIEITLNEQLAEELHKPIIKKF